MNSLRVEKFLFSFSIRCGALTIVWSVLLLCSYTSIICWFFMMNIDNDGAKVPLLFCLIISFAVQVLALLTLIYFPAPNKTYSPDSKTAKYLKYFTWYLGSIIGFFVVVFSFLPFLREFDASELVVYKGDIVYKWKYLCFALIVFIVFPVFLIASVLHLMAVIHTFRLSILPNKNLDEIDLNVRDK